MKNFIKNLLTSILAALLVGGFVLAANTFPTTLNDWEDDEVIESGWADSLEIKIGVDGSAVITSLDYLLKNAASTDPGHLHTSAGISGTLSDAVIANDITLTNITQITNRAISDTTGTLTASRGGTGIDSSALTGIIRVDSGTWSATTTIGSSASRLAKGWFTDLDATDATIGTLNISGSVNPGPLVVATSTNPTIQFLNDTNSGIGWIDYDKISLMTSGTSQLIVDSTGQVGIGTTTPSALLTVGASENSQFLVNSSGVVTGGTWQGTAIADLYVADDITLTNITQITNRAISDTTGTLTVGRGGTGATTLTGLVLGNGANAMTAYAGTSCSNQFPRSLNASGVATCATVDISSDTNLTAGRSLTLTGDDIAVDSELFTKSFSIVVKNATTTSNPAAQHSIPNNITLTKVKCWEGVGTTTIQFEERAEATPNTTGTTTLSATLDCVPSSMASTTSFADSSIAANELISLDIIALDSVASSTIIMVEYTVND